MTNKIHNKIGIGFRREFAEEFLDKDTLQPNFIELAPENWIDLGGFWGKKLKKAAEKYPILSHGLSLSIGSAEKLDMGFLKKIKAFLTEYNIEIYSEHLSYTKAANAHLYELLPIPFRKDAVKHIVERIKTVQDFLDKRIAMEIVSYYTPVAAEMDEATFISSIINEADCDLLLDVNNIYVNGFNHNYNAKEFINKLPLDKVAYIHMAGHKQIAEDLIIDTHGEVIIDPVYDLFDYTIQKIKPVPVLLERDFNIPELDELQKELEHLDNICTKNWNNHDINQNQKYTRTIGKVRA